MARALYYNILPQQRGRQFLMHLNFRSLDVLELFVVVYLHSKVHTTAALNFNSACRFMLKWNYLSVLFSAQMAVRS